MGIPQNGSFIMENQSINRWFGGTPILGNPHGEWMGDDGKIGKTIQFVEHWALKGWSEHFGKTPKRAWFKDVEWFQSIDFMSWKQWEVTDQHRPLACQHSSSPIYNLTNYARTIKQYQKPSVLQEYIYIYIYIYIHIYIYILHHITMFTYFDRIDRNWRMGLNTPPNDSLIQGAVGLFDPPPCGR